MSALEDDAHPAILDDELFTAPYIVIDQNNNAIAITDTHEHAQHVLGKSPLARSIVGTLRPPLIGIDIDPADTNALAETGQTLAEDLTVWCDEHNLSRLVRASGRPGHRHLIIAAPTAIHPRLREITARFAHHHGLPVSVRRTLRLLTAPHRNAYPAPLLDSNLTRAAIRHTAHVTSPVAQLDAIRTRPAPSVHRYRSTRNRVSRSEGEFGDACARARAGWTAQQAWNAAHIHGSKAAEIGETAWRRYFWAPAVTINDAEQHRTAHQAWINFRRASPTQAHHLGYHRWHTERWQPALLEARTARPRRRRLNRSPPDDRDQPTRSASVRIDELRRQLHQIAEHLTRDHTDLPNRIRRTTLYIALHALAPAVVNHGGSISVRQWAEAARLDPRTVRRARDAAAQLGIINRTHTYDAGTTDSDAWQPTTLATRSSSTETQSSQQKSPTTRYAPTPTRTGRANLERLKRTHHTERQHWNALCEKQAINRTLRSLNHQHRWWTSLTPAQQENRRAQRKTTLAALAPAQRARWFSWLRQRRTITAVANHIREGVTRSHDHRVIRNAPYHIHHGLSQSAKWIKTVDLLGGFRQYEVVEVNSFDRAWVDQNNLYSDDDSITPAVNIAPNPGGGKSGEGAASRVPYRPTTVGPGEGHMPQDSTPTPTQPRFLNVRQAAHLLQVSPMTLYRAIEAGEFPALKIRGRYTIPAQAIENMEATVVQESREMNSADFHLAADADPCE
ncbi:helix-turn-helix domain-containing protein [Sciscionella marina]|uniref:helix-turn-helix domain-containing protein n=1 Tax=Sciscionella marina TaxID=508770 RepID=UPI001969B9D2|nr:helix-turn-helix domain-containing protein [Sciscionella marina]